MCTLLKVSRQPPEPPQAEEQGDEDGGFMQWTALKHKTGVWKKDDDSDWYTRMIDVIFTEKGVQVKFNGKYPNLILITKILTDSELNAVFGYTRPGESIYLRRNIREIPKNINEEQIWATISLELNRRE